MPQRTDKRCVEYADHKDQGWAWVICGALFCIYVVSMGYLRVFGILFVAFQDEFLSSASVTASIMGVYSVVYSITSLIACNVLLEKFSARQICIVGGIIVAVGVALDVFAYSIGFLMCTNGIIVGIGNALFVGPGIIILGMYFERRRTLATAIVFTGASVGGIVLPPIVRFILDEYGVRGAMLIFGAILFHIVPASMLLIPIKRANISVQMQEKHTSEGDSSIPFTNEVDCPERKEYTSMESEGQLNRLSCSLCEIPLVIPTGKGSDEGETSSGIYKNVTTSLFKSLPSDLNTYHSHNRKGDIFHRPVCHDDGSLTSEPGKHNRNILSNIKIIMDISLFKSPLFCAFVGFHLFGCAGISTFPSFVPPIAKENGLPDIQGALLVSLHAGIDLFCRILTGIIADLGWFKRYRMLATAYIILGTVYQFVRYCTSFPLMVLYSVMFGMFSGCFYSLHPSIAVDFFGREKFPKVFGYVQFFRGIVTTVSYPIIGGLREFTGSYAASCHFLGASLYAAAFLLLIKPIFKK